MNVLVLYHSRYGHTQAAAERVAQAVRALNHQATVVSVTQVRAADVEKADVLFVGTWVQGFILLGVKPAGADLWVPSLPSLKGKPVGIFCTYLFHPYSSLHKLAAMLEARGAAICGQQAFRRNRLDRGMEQFVRRVLSSAEHARDS